MEDGRIAGFEIRAIISRHACHGGIIRVSTVSRRNGARITLKTDFRPMTIDADPIMPGRMAIPP